MDGRSYCSFTHKNIISELRSDRMKITILEDEFGTCARINGVGNPSELGWCISGESKKRRWVQPYEYFK